MPARRAIRVVLFDLDGTLYDERGGMHSALSRTFAEAVRLIPGFDTAAAEQLYPEVGRLVWETADLGPGSPVSGSFELRCRVWGDLLERLGAPGSTAELLAACYARARTASHRLYPEAISVLSRLSRLGGAVDRTRVGLVSNGASDLQREKLEICGLSSRLDPILISAEVGWVKPAPEIFLEAVRRSVCRPEEALFVGDSPEKDVVGARQAGLQAAWVNRTEAAFPISLPPPDFILTDLATVPEIVARSFRQRDGSAR